MEDEDMGARLSSNIKKIVDSISDRTIEKGIQPFKTNTILKEILESQTPKWVNYCILVMTLIALIFTTLSTYKILFN